jgi:hypothetical protein
MNTRIMKLIVGGTLALLVTLIVTGTASARIYVAGQPSPTAQHAQTSPVVVGYGDFPEVVRTMNLSTAAHTATSGSSFEWSDAGVAAGIGIGVLCMFGLVTVGVRRGKATPAAA